MWVRDMKELKNRSVQKTTVGLSIAAFAAMCVVVLIILWNSSLLKEAIEERTKNYLDDVSVQTAQIIDSRLQASLDSLMLLADSDFDLDAEPLLDFLQKKAAVLNFDMLGIADAKEGTVFSSSGQEDFKNLPEFASALTGESSIGVYQNYILYTVPVYKDGSVAGVLAGVKTTEKMQELISNNAFHGEGSTCVVDSEGHVIVDPTRKQFSSLIAETTYDANADWAKSMLRDLAQNKAGSSVLPTESGVGIMMSYQPLKYYEWFVVTLIPKDILSAQITSIVNQTFAIAIFLVSLF